MIAIKTRSFKSVKQLLSTTTDLELVAAEIETDSNQKFLFCSVYRPPDSDRNWINQFDKFLDETCNTYKNIGISGDFNFPKISWEFSEPTPGVTEQSFVDILNDHFLTQHNKTPTRGDNVLDLVISNVPEQVNITEVLAPDKMEIFTDHSAMSFELVTSIKAPPKINRSVYGYGRGDFERLRSSLREANLSNCISAEGLDINND